MKKAFTLIEVLVASLILTIGITGMLWSFVACQKILMENSNVTNANHIINKHFENLQRCETKEAVNLYLTTNAETTEKRLVLNDVERYYRTTLTEIGSIYPIPTNNLSIIEAEVFWDDNTKSIKNLIISNEP